MKYYIVIGFVFYFFLKEKKWIMIIRNKVNDEKYIIY